MRQPLLTSTTYDPYDFCDFYDPYDFYDSL